jgi:hypothetical protein
MGFISNLFSKKNKNLQTVSNESSTDSKENMSIIDKEGFDYSLLSYDNAGWLTYPDGLKCRNVSQLFCDTFDDRLYDVILDTKEKLGYNDGEVFYIYLDKNGKRLFSYECESTYFVGFWELFTNKFLCFVTLNAHVMNQQEIEQYQRYAAKEWNNVIWGDKLERGMGVLTDIWQGIQEQSISQEFVEKVFDVKAVNNQLAVDKYLFTFENGLLSDCYYDDYNVMIFDIFNGETIDEYMENANKHWKSEKAMKTLINLQAIYSTRISQEILSSDITCKKYAYDEWGLCINYIAMGTFFQQFDMDQETFIASTDGKYEILSNNVANGIKTTRIRAYNEVFTFTNGHSMPGEAIGKVIKDKDDFRDSSEGYVYVMTNSSIEGQVKIGKTTRDPYERAKELSSATGVPTPFVVVFYKPFKDCHFAEKMIHQYLEKKGYRVNNNREFFSMSIPEAIDVVQSMYAIEQKQV